MAPSNWQPTLLPSKHGTHIFIIVFAIHIASLENGLGFD